ncbi:hypothetical protein BANRA_02754 [Acinetobacter baumannii]|nr:hypothetical protein BANRA_02754 [Acinetobacter baumannii]
MPSITPKLKHRITIQKPIQTQDQNTGKLIVTWLDFTRVWAEVTDLSTRDVIAAKAANSLIQARAKVRYSSTTKQVDSTMRVLLMVTITRLMGTQCETQTHAVSI